MFTLAPFRHPKNPSMLRPHDVAQESVFSTGKGGSEVQMLFIGLVVWEIVLRCLIKTDPPVIDRGFGRVHRCLHGS